MRQATWEEFFKGPELPQEQAPQKPPWWQKFAVFSWEELVTFVIVFIVFMAVVQSIDSANWVDEMPSLYPIALFGLVLGIVLAKTPLNELIAHTLALLTGAAAVVIGSTGDLQGSLEVRVRELYDRMDLWFTALTTGGISNDNLPFVVMVVALTYLTAYVSAWSLFRWYNAWIGLIPGGLALLTNISYLPGQSSGALMVFLFGSILLVSRMHVLRRERDWRRSGTRYPDLISLHVLNVTVWVALALILFAWVLPVGSGGGLLYDVWQKATAPIAGPFQEMGRVFASIDSKKGGTVHRFGSTLPLQGEITLGGGQVAEVVPPEAPLFLRAQTYDQYTSQGWKISGSSTITSTSWPALRALQSPEEARRQFRRPISVQITPSRRQNVILSAGQPLSVSVDSRVVYGADQSDVTSIRPSGTLNRGVEYRVEGTISSASQTRLRQAGTSYPAWIAPYLQLPDSLPRNVVNQALDLTRGMDNAYDKATAIEQFLRTNFPVDTKIQPAPPNRDSVAYFLFDARRGYFDYHASAMVVMLRSLGIPARIAVGYVVRPADRLPDTSTYILSEANAFAWPEVYFPGLGWVEFNPTPSEPRIVRPGTDDSDLLPGELDELPVDELVPEDPGIPIEPATPAVEQLATDEGSTLIGNILMALALGVLALTVAGLLGFQFAWRRGLGGLDFASQTWEKTLRLASWARIPAYPQETPREYTARLRHHLPEVDDIGFLGDAYVRARYGAKSLSEQEKERLDSVWKAVRKNLLNRLMRWG
ncbi:MAG TPA: transglutaminase domain-containing protein [Dehalococcoidia bacterium]|nr:transglutaminase domain-containing protein [Dehalococcoidia bacterium]